MSVSLARLSKDFGVLLVLAEGFSIVATKFEWCTQ